MNGWRAEPDLKGMKETVIPQIIDEKNHFLSFEGQQCMWFAGAHVAELTFGCRCAAL